MLYSESVSQAWLVFLFQQVAVCYPCAANSESGHDSLLFAQASQIHSLSKKDKRTPWGIKMYELCESGLIEDILQAPSTMSGDLRA